MFVKNYECHIDSCLGDVQLVPVEDGSKFVATVIAQNSSVRASPLDVVALERCLSKVWSLFLFELIPAA